MAGLSTFDVGGCCCGPDTLPCLPCPIPKRDLTITYVDHTFGTFFLALLYAPSPWSTGCITFLGGNHYVFNFGCLGGTFLTQTSFGGGDSTCLFPLGAPFDWHPYLVDYTCIPYHLHYHLVGTSVVDLYIDE